jgi:DNA-binding response OmpR family regulator
VLVIDDHPGMRHYVRRHLESSFQVLEAKDGREGVELALEAIPDLVICDVMMPQLDGFQVCERLKTNEKTSHVPVILLTAKAGEESKLAGLETGADDYLIKPFNSRELQLRVHNLIEQRRKLRERFRGTVILKPSEMAVTSTDEVFLNKVLAVVEKHLDEEEFSVETLGQEVGMSRSQIHRKLRALTNQPPILFIRSIRLQRAADLLRQNAGSIAEIAYQVGFSSQAYFTKCFHEQFGVSPKEFRSKAESQLAG